MTVKQPKSKMTDEQREGFLKAAYAFAIMNDEYKKSRGRKKKSKSKQKS